MKGQIDFPSVLFTGFIMLIVWGILVRIWIIGPQDERVEGLYVAALAVALVPYIGVILLSIKGDGL